MKKHKAPGQMIDEAIKKNQEEESGCWPEEIFKEDVLKLMKKYAAQQSIAFYKWMESECYDESVLSTGLYNNILTNEWYTLKQLYNKFLKSQK